MSEDAPSHGIIRFGGFEVDFRKGEVRKHGYRLRIQDQPFHILQILLEHPGELVTREEIQRHIWPADTFVDFEKGLNNAIRKLRDVLGDSAEEPQFIETQSRRGYRFIGSVTATNGTNRTEEAASLVEVGVPAHSRPLYRRLAIGAVLFLAFVATLFGFDIGGVREHWLTRASSPVIHSLAVLPLQNLSNDPNQDYFSDGMTDALITDLAQISSVKVISRTSVIHYKTTDKTLPEIARELNVDGIIEGTVQRSGDRVRITAQLIYGPSDKHLWANSYERDARSVLSMESEIAGAIAKQIETKLTPEQEARLTKAPLNIASGRIQNIAPEEMWKRVTQCVFPTYSNLASATHISGTVDIGLAISPEGDVASISRVLDGPPLLVRSAMDAIRQWRFRPNIVQGEVTWSRVRSLVRFNADGTTAVELAPAILPDNFGDPGTPRSDAAAFAKPAAAPECKSAQASTGSEKGT